MGIMICLWEILILSIFSRCIYEISVLSLYYSNLYNDNSDWREWISFKEKLCYYLSHYAQYIPTFGFAPTWFDVDSAWKQLKECDGNIWLKLFYVLKLIVIYVMWFTGYIFNDLILIGTLLYEQDCVDIGKIYNAIYDVNWRQCVEWISNHIIKSSVILTVAIICIAICRTVVKKQLLHYRFENIWLNNNDNINIVADCQMDIVKALCNIKNAVSKNIYACEENIKILHDVDGSNDILLSYNFYDFTHEIDNIKMALQKIYATPNGADLYGEYNQKIFAQVQIFDLIPGSENVFYLMNRCNSTFIDEIKIDNDNTFGDMRLRKQCGRFRFGVYLEEAVINELLAEFRESKKYGIACVNGIDRYIGYIRKRMRKYQKISNKLMYIDAVKEMGEYIDSKKNK